MLEKFDCFIRNLEGLGKFTTGLTVVLNRRLHDLIIQYLSPALAWFISKEQIFQAELLESTFVIISKIYLEVTGENKI